MGQVHRKDSENEFKTGADHRTDATKVVEGPGAWAVLQLPWGGGFLCTRGTGQFLELTLEKGTDADDPPPPPPC